jgi:hypothetical protein
VISAIWMLGYETPLYRFMYAHLPHLVRARTVRRIRAAAFCSVLPLPTMTAVSYVGRETAPHACVQMREKLRAA